MKKRWVGLSVFLVATTAWAGNGLWVDGADRPNERVNVGANSLHPEVFKRVAEKVVQSVVNISTTQASRGGHMFSPFGSPRGRSPKQGPGNQDPFGDFFGNDLFEHFFGSPPAQERPRWSSLGSGFILSADGYVVTNNHVVERAQEIKVILSDESELKATVVGRDPKTDVALLKVDRKETLPSAMLGDSDQLDVGEVVVAIGNPFGLSHTVTQGIVSAKERSIGHGAYDDFIQTDASINPGNSGGPLLNLHGEVIGINTAIVASAQGIGFAIPINLAKSILLKLKKDGKVVRGWLGVVIQKITSEHALALKLPSRHGALVSEVTPGSPADKAMFKAADVIVTFGGRKIHDWHQLPIAVAGTSVGEQVNVGIVRDGKKKRLQVTIAKLEDEESEVEAKKTSKADLLGLTVQDLTTQMRTSLGIEAGEKGVLVSEVAPGGVAQIKGVRRGDVILEVNRKRVVNRSSYRKVVSKLKKGDTVLLLMKRGKVAQFIAFTL